MLRQAPRILGGIVAAIAATVFTIYAFDITTPPRDIETILRPTPTQTTFVASVPTATPQPTSTPAPRNLIYSANLTKAGEWPDTASAHYTRTGYQLTTASNSDFLAVPLEGFEDTAKLNIKIVA